MKRFHRDGATYRYDSPQVQVIIFGAKGKCFWAWGAWPRIHAGGHRFQATGIEFSLKDARQKAIAAIEEVEEPSAERKP